MSTRMAWSGACDECGTLVTIVASDEVSEAEQERISGEWPEMGDCYVQDCFGSIDWNGNDPVGDVLVRESHDSGASA